MAKQKGQMKIVAGIVVLLLIIGIVIATQLFGKPKGEQPQKGVQTKESQAPKKKEPGFFDQLFGTTPTETKTADGKEPGFFDRLFGGTKAGEKPAPSSQDGFFDKLFGGGKSPAPSGSPETPLAPVISSGSPTGDLPVETRRVNLSVKTDKIATCRHGSVSGLSYESMQNVFSQTNSTSHSTEVTGFNEGIAYKYYVKCLDQAGNKNTSDFVISFKILAAKDTTPPIVRNPSHVGDILPRDAVSTVISVTTDEPANCRYSATQGILYNSMNKSFTHYDQSKRFHVATVTGLQYSKTYEFFARCKDLAGNVNTGDVMISFSVR